MAHSEHELEDLVVAAAAGDAKAWHDLWCTVQPRLCRLLRRSPHWRDDLEVRDVVIAVMARLRAEGHRRLRLYLTARALDPELTFMRWLIVLARRVLIDCVRTHPDYVDRRRSAAATAGSLPSGQWIHATPLTADALEMSAGDRGTCICATLTARLVMRRAVGLLSEPQRRALELWAQETPSAEIAASLGLAGGEDATRLVRSAVERLRRRFAAKAA